jgi:type IV secretion system protein VirB8
MNAERPLIADGNVAVAALSPTARDEADTYFADAASWADDRGVALTRSRKIAWIVALIAAGVALAEAVALMLLMPLKTVVPYTLLVDRQTGYVQALDPIKSQSIAPDTALTQSFLVQYVLAREGFDIATLQDSYRKTLLWSEGGAKTDYAALMPVTNPDSPLVRLPRTTIIDVRVRSVSAMTGRTALVRFDTQRRDKGGVAQPPQAWVALINYRFSTAPLSTEDRFINPLGFQVTRYARNAETPPLPVDGAPPPAAPTNAMPLPALSSGAAGGGAPSTGKGGVSALRA